ncbi:MULTISPECIES: hypothetical protein [unclassified Brenneria]|uniref:hypothetical protein n=1 Tax=unclassified Brenneria TaxID=2634434 RepID=UPI0018F05F1D|nr:hypothetical protein [Brenneria sp. L3-3C-1]MBJ7223592.1 hypothetical protein [Brenneria sp. L3-3C-1]MEE3644834.1 hypothetical protein [Brenneria sp. L3_3C_1]
MDGLDFSDVTDDQLVELARACCLEALRRSPASAQAMRDMMLSEAEKARIAREASEAEIRAARARERERIAREAAAQTRYEEERRTASQRAASAAQAAERARILAAEQRHRDMTLLRQAAAMVNKRPGDISILHCHTASGMRLMINPGWYRYARNHLVDYHIRTAAIRTVQALVKRKQELIDFCAAAAAVLPPDSFLSGSEYRWHKE